MTAIVTETVAITTVKPAITIKGKGAAARMVAFTQIAPLSMIENTSRAESIANLAKALGASPSDAEVKTAQTEWTIGRVASRLAAGDFPKGTNVRDESARLEAARALVLHYAAPKQEGKQARKLRAGQLGYRTETQHKAIRAADVAWAMVKAELGIGTGKTQKELNDQKRTRATNANPVRGDGKGKDTAKPAHTPTLSETLPNGGKLKSAAEVCRIVETAAATLLALANKNAKLLPTDYGMAIQAFKTAINQAANARGEREAAADANAAAK